MTLQNKNTVKIQFKKLINQNTNRTHCFVRRGFQERERMRIRILFKKERERESESERERSDFFYGVRIPPRAIACINTCVHVKDPVVHVRVRWIMETLKHPACTVDWVARLCRSWLPPGKAIRISHGRNPSGTIQLCSSSNNNNTFGFELTRP